MPDAPRLTEFGANSLNQSREAKSDPLHHSVLARMLISDIQSGRYLVGDKLPTEAELQKLFDTSRYAVREALRQLKEQGLIWARGGVGTVVRATAPKLRQMRGEGSIFELIQFVDANRMQVLSRRSFVAGKEWAAQFGGPSGQQWQSVSVLRRLPERELPVAFMEIYLRPEHADVIEDLDSSRQPVFSLLQQRHHVDIAEVRQQIVAIVLDPSVAKAVQAAVGAPALLITRHYTDSSDRIVLLSVGRYPSDRFVHDTRFRISD